MQVAPAVVFEFGHGPICGDLFPFDDEVCMVQRWQQCQIRTTQRLLRGVDTCEGLDIVDEYAQMLDIDCILFKKQRGS